MTTAIHPLPARFTDPDTSHEAAVGIQSKVGCLRGQAVDIVTRHPGKTARELDQLNNTEAEGAIRKRLKECECEGLIYASGKRKCSVTNKSAQLWWPGRRPSGVPYPYPIPPVFS